MKVLVHLPEPINYNHAVSVEMPAVPRVGDLIGVDHGKTWLVVTEVHWEIFTTEPIAGCADPSIVCAHYESEAVS